MLGAARAWDQRRTWPCLNGGRNRKHNRSLKLNREWCSCTIHRRRLTKDAAAYGVGAG